MRFNLSAPMFNSDGGGSGAPVSSPFTGGGGRPGQVQPQGGSQDTQELLAMLTQEIEGTKQRVSQAEQRSAGLEGIIGNIKTAVTGQPTEQQVTDWYEDELLPHLFQLEKEGKSHPMTATLAKELKAAQLREAQLEQRLAQLEQAQKQTQNPEFQSDDRAYSQMDDMITTELESVYGEASPNLHRAIGANIAADLARIQKEFPDKWRDIRRSPEKLNKIVAHHITLMIPPKAVNVMRQQQEDNTPITLDLVNQAIAEFHQNKHNMSPEQRQQVAKILREQHLSISYSQNRRLPQRRR